MFTNRDAADVQGSKFVFVIEVGAVNLWSWLLTRYYQPGEQRAAKVDELFTKIALRYDLINDLQSLGLHRLWKWHLVRLAGPAPGQRALDVCCGTGDLAFALARFGTEVVGVDFNERMLDVAARRAVGRGVQTPTSKIQSPKSEHGIRNTQHVPSPTFLLGDAQALPFPDNQFDIVTIGYGLRNLASWEAGLCEMKRVAAPGGRLLVLDFGKPSNRLLRALYFGYLRFFIPLLGLVFCRDAAAYAYILDSLKHYPAQRGVEDKMRKLGLANVRTVNLLGGMMAINLGTK